MVITALQMKAYYDLKKKARLETRQAFINKLLRFRMEDHLNRRR